ncbi:MAG: NB-ARC domain-containing protein [Chloroflexota bacterium]
MSQNSFSGILSSFMERESYPARKLSKQTAILFGETSLIPHTTIDRWAKKEVKRPRGWQGVVKVATAMALSLDEMDRLLQAAQYPIFIELKQQHTDSDSQDLLLIVEQRMLGKQNQSKAPFQALSTLPYYIDHTDRVKKLQKRILSEDCPPIICIEGMPGVGKTTLATQLCHRLRPYFVDGVLWIELGKSNPKSVLHHIAWSYGVDLYHEADVSVLSSRVRTILATKRVLMVLDGVQSEDEVRNLMPPTDNSLVLMTSHRRDLSIADSGERFFLSPFLSKESLDLFKQIVGDSVVTSARKAYRDLADLLGHHPAAIRIAANQIRHCSILTVHCFIEMLQEPTTRLSTLARGSDQLIPLLHAGCALLQQETRQFIDSLLEHGRGWFTIDTAGHLSGLSQEATRIQLMTLYHHCLLETRDTHYRLHPLVYDYFVMQRDGYICRSPLPV